MMQLLHHEFAHYDHVLLKNVDNENDIIKQLVIVMNEIDFLVMKIDFDFYLDNHDLFLSEYFADIYGLKEFEKRLRYYKVSTNIIETSMKNFHLFFQKKYYKRENDVRTVNPRQEFNKMILNELNEYIELGINDVKLKNKIREKINLENKLIASVTEVEDILIGELRLTSLEISKIISIIVQKYKHVDLIAEQMQLVNDIVSHDIDKLVTKYNDPYYQKLLLITYQKCLEGNISLSVTENQLNNLVSHKFLSSTIVNEPGNDALVREDLEVRKK
jgi:hypothetical protein